MLKNKVYGSVVKRISHLTTDILRLFNSFIINTILGALTTFYQCRQYRTRNEIHPFCILRFVLISIAIINLLLF